MARLLTKLEAAGLMGVHVRTFERLARPGTPAGLRVIRLGSRMMVDPEDLARWLEARKVGGDALDGRSGSTASPGSSKSGSPGRGIGTSSERGRQIAAELKKQRRAATPRLFPVAAPPGR